MSSRNSADNGSEQNININKGFAMSKTYEIVRFYAEDGHPDHGKIIKSGLTIEEAKEHCQDPDTEEKGVWFDGFREE